MGFEMFPVMVYITYIYIDNHQNRGYTLGIFGKLNVENEI